MPERKSPAAKPETLQVQPLTTPTPLQTKRGRKKKPEMPPLPQEIYEGMSDLERQHFDFFVEAFMHELPDPSPIEIICVRMGALDYINSLRLQVEQLRSGQLVTMSRQHPAVQLRAWIDAALRRRKQGGKELTQEQEERASLKSVLLGLSS